MPIRTQMSLSPNAQVDAACAATFAEMRDVVKRIHFLQGRLSALQQLLAREAERPAELDRDAELMRLLKENEELKKQMLASSGASSAKEEGSSPVVLDRPSIVKVQNAMIINKSADAKKAVKEIMRSAKMDASKKAPTPRKPAEKKPVDAEAKPADAEAKPAAKKRQRKNPAPERREDAAPPVMSASAMLMMQQQDLVEVERNGIKIKCTMEQALRMQML